MKCSNQMWDKIGLSSLSGAEFSQLDYLEPSSYYLESIPGCFSVHQLERIGQGPALTVKSQRS